MSIPSQKDLQISLLHLIHDMGGEVKPNDVYDRLADYFGLTKKEREEIQPSGVSRKFDNRVAWARLSLCHQGLLDGSLRGIWKITEIGRKELSRLGLIDKPLPRAATLQGQGVLTTTKGTKEVKSDDEELLELILVEIAPYGPKQFPDDFLDNKDCTDFYEVELPGTQLHFAPLSQTIIASPRGYFHYQAKNPPEAKYVLYSHKVGLKRVKVPRDNLILFKAVKTYERYCDEVTRRSFELFLEFTYDEQKAELLANEIANRLDVRRILSKPGYTQR